jgi:hypothetical protein
MARRLVAALLATLAAGCLPVPNRRTVSPAIDGRLLREGVPQAGVRVSRCVASWNCSCESADEHVLTDADGRFHLPERAQWFAALDTGERSPEHVLLCYGEAPARVLWSSGAADLVPGETLVCDVVASAYCGAPRHVPIAAPRPL